MLLLRFYTPNGYQSHRQRLLGKVIILNLLNYLIANVFLDTLIDEQLVEVIVITYLGISEFSGLFSSTGIWLEFLKKILTIII